MDEALIKQIKTPLRRGDAYMEVKNYAQAVESYLEALMANTGDVSLNMNIGEAYMKMGNFKEAKQTFEEVIRILPDSTLAKNYLKKIDADSMLTEADNHLKRNELHEAMEHYTQILQIAQNHVGALYGIARILMEQGEEEKALTLFEKIAETDDIHNADYKHILNHVAISLRKSGRLERSLALYRKAIGIDPADEVLHFNLSGAYWKNGERELAVSQAQKALEINPEFEEARTLLEHYQKQMEDRGQRTEDRRQTTEKSKNP